jgi:hypothetical protein
MMKTKLPLFTFVLLVCTVLTVGTGKADASKMGVFSFSWMPSFDVSLTGLDARDENNNPSSTPSSKQDLESVFRTGLYDCLITADIFSFAQAFAMLKQKVNPSGSSFSRSIQRLSGIISALAPSTKKILSRMIARISGIFYQPIVLSFPALSPFLTFCTPSVSVTCLRC